MDFLAWTKHLIKKIPIRAVTHGHARGICQAQASLDGLREKSQSPTANAVGLCPSASLEEGREIKEPRPRKDRRRHPRFSFDAPLEYSTSVGSRPRGAYTGNVSEKGLLIYSIDTLPIVTELKLVVFYPDEYRLGNFEVFARVVWKDCHYEKEWMGFKYGLEFAQMSETDQIKLRKILLEVSVRENKFLGQIVESGHQAMEATPQQNN